MSDNITPKQSDVTPGATQQPPAGRFSFLDIPNQGAPDSPSQAAKIEAILSTPNTHPFADEIREYHDRRIIANINQYAEDPLKELENWEYAKALGSFFHISPETVYQDLPKYHMMWGGSDLPKTAPKAIWDAGAAMATRMKMANLVSEMNGWNVGDVISGQGGVEVGPDRKREIVEELAILEEQFNKYSTDELPRSWLTNLGKLVAGVIPFSAMSVGTGLAVNAGVMAAGALTGLAIPAAIGNTLTSVMNFANASKIMAGMSYLDMTANGIDEDVAKQWAPVSGIIQGALEATISAEAFGSLGLGKVFVNNLTTKVLQKVGATGILHSAGAKTVANILISSTFEGITEAGQSLTDGAVQIMAQSLTEDGTIVDPITIRTMARSAGEEFVAALITAPLIGLAGHISQYTTDRKKLMQLSELATTMSKEDFTNVVVDSGALDGPLVTPENMFILIGDIYDNAEKRTLDQAKQIDQATAEQVKSGTVESPVYRDEAGELHLEEMVTRSEGPVQEVTMQFGDPRADQTYGTVTANIDARSKNITMLNSDISNDMIGLTKEVIDQFMSRYPGYQIQMQENSTDITLSTAVDMVVEQRSSTPFQQENEVDSQAFKRFETYLQKTGMKESIITPVAKFVEGFASITGLSMAQYSDPLGVTLNKGEEKFPSGKVPGGYKLAGAYTRLGNYSNDPRFTKIFLKDAERVVAVFTDKVKALNTNDNEMIDTIFHELAHDFRYMVGKHSPDAPGLLALEKAYGITDKKWTAEAEERFVDDLRAYLHGKKVDVPDEAKNIFQRIGDFFKALIDSVAGKLKPEVVQAFDELIGNAVLPLADAIPQGSNRLDAGAGTHQYMQEKKIQEQAEQNGISNIDIATEKSRLGPAIETLLERFPNMNTEKRDMLEDGSWVANPQVIAEIKYLTGMREIMTQVELDTITMALQQAGENAMYTLGYTTEAMISRRRERQEATWVEKLAETLTKEEAIKLAFQSFTALPNKKKYDQDIKENGGPTPIQVMIDVDSLKFVNDSFGHKYGDEMLTIISDVLYNSSDLFDVGVYHFSGDEFGIQANTVEDAKAVLSRLEDALAKRMMGGTIVMHPEYEFEYKQLGLSYGINEEGDMAAADMAMLAQKKERQDAGKRRAREDLPAGLTIRRKSDGKILSENEARVLLGLQERRQGASGENAQGAQGYNRDVSWSLPAAPAVDVAVDQIQFHPEMTQFKEGANPKTGVVKKLPGKRYERIGTAPIVLWETGQLYIVTGRHRLDLARRLGETTIPAQIIRDSDFTPVKAMAMDAVANIRDGKGTVKDYVRFVMQNPMSEETAINEGVMDGEFGRIGYNIAMKADESVRSAFMNDKLKPMKADAIIRGSNGIHGIQEALLRSASKMSADELFNFGQVLVAQEASGGLFGGGKETTGSLFDTDDFVQIEARALRISGAIAKHVTELQRERTIISGAIRQGGEASREVLKEFGHNPGDINGMADRYEILNSEIEAWESGWSLNPVLMNKALQMAGLEYDSTLASQPIKLAQEVKHIEDSPEPSLFSLTKDVEDIVAQSPLLFSMSKATRMEDEHTTMSATDFKTMDEWLSYMFTYPENLTDDERAYFQSRFDYAHNLQDGKVERKFKERGDFTKFLASEGNFNSFVYRLRSLLSGRKTEQGDIDRAARIRGAISKTPQLKMAVEEGKSLGAAQKKALLGLVRKNEGLYKYLYAMAWADPDLANEALSDIQNVPELTKRDLTGSKDFSIADQEQILEDLRDTILIDKIKNNSITLDEVDEFIAGIEGKAKQQIDEARMEERQKAKEKISDVKTKAKAKEETYRAQMRQYLAAKKLKAQMQKLNRSIMRRVPASVDLRHAAVIRVVQEIMRRGPDITMDEIKKLHSASSYAFAGDPLLDAGPGATLEYIYQIVQRNGKSDSGTWTMDGLKEVAGLVKDMLQTGRAALRKREKDWGIEVKNLRGKILNELSSSKWYKKGLTHGSEERKKHMEKMNLLGMTFDVDRPDAWVRAYLGDTAHKLLFKDLVTNDRKKLDSYDRRVKKVTQFITDNKMQTNKGLFRKMTIKGVGMEGADFTITGSELLGMRLMIGRGDQYDAQQREAFIYGNLFSATEKNVDGTFKRDTDVQVNDYMRSKYDEKLAALEAFIDANMTAEEEQLAQIIMNTFNDETDWYRFANAVYSMTNKEPKKTKYYFPLVRQGVMTTGEDNIISKLAQNGMHVALDQGMSLERKNIQPRNHKPVKYDALGVFYEAIMKQEHLTEMGPYIKKLQGSFRNSVFGESVHGVIEDSLGRKAWDFINNQIDAVTNPEAFKPKADGSDMLGALRGTMIVSNLAWRASSVFMQLLTSPLPTLAVAPLDLLKVSLEAWSRPFKFGKNGHSFYQDIEEKNSILRHRQLLPEKRVIEQRVEQGVATFMEKVAKVGMTGLNWADRHSVAISWEAVRRAEYRKRYQKLTAAQKAEPGPLKTIEMEAMNAADEFVIQTQPTSESHYRAPLYRNMTAFKQAILQFTQPLNVIWNNLRHDVPDAARRNEYNKVIGFITAYALSGLAMGLVGVVRGRGPEDDADEKERAMYWLHAMSAQYTDSIPFIGQIVSSLTGYAMTGKNESWMRMDVNMPAVDLFARAGDAIIQKNPEKVLKNTLLGLGYVSGAPNRAILNTIELGNKLFGEE